MRPTSPASAQCLLIQYSDPLCSEPKYEVVKTFHSMHGVSVRTANIVTPISQMLSRHLNLSLGPLKACYEVLQAEGK